MIRLSLTIISALLLGCSAPSSDYIFETEFFGQNNDMPRDAVELADHSILIAGQHFPNDYNSNPEASQVASLVKLGEKGEFHWEKKFGHHKDDRVQQIIEKNGQIFILGTSTSTDYTGRKVWVLKVDSSGNVLKEATFGASTSGLHMCFGTGDELYLLGETSSHTPSRKYDNRAYYLFKTDLALNLLSEKIIEQEKGFHSLDNIYWVEENLYLVGKSLNTDHTYQMFVKTFDTNGVEKHHQDIVLSKRDGPMSSVLNKNKIIIITYNETNDNAQVIYTCDLSTHTISVTDLTLTYKVFVNDITVNHKGHYILSGSTWGDYHYYLNLELDPSYHIVKETKYGNQGSIDEWRKCLELKDKHLLTVGNTNFDTPNPMCNKWVVKKWVE